VTKIRVAGGDGPRLKDLLHVFDAGSVIFREGDLGREMYIIQKGHVRISLAVGGKERELAVLEKGDFFGETALLNDSPVRSATATAVDDVEVLKLSASDLNELLKRKPDIAVRMMMKLSERLREANRRFEELGTRNDLSAMTPAPARQGIEACALLAHKASGRIFPLKAAVDSTVGRHDPVTGVTPDVDLTPLDPERTVSRRHATVASVEGNVTITETSAATNGTFLNGNRLEPFKAYPLSHGDSVQLALVTLRLHLIHDGG
jgi:hypothetical protein